MDCLFFSGYLFVKFDVRWIVFELYFDEFFNIFLDIFIVLEFCKYFLINIFLFNVDEIGLVDSIVNEGSVYKFGLEGFFYCIGYLIKKGKNFGGWKVRFFVFDGFYLKYYEVFGGVYFGMIKFLRV